MNRYFGTALALLALAAGITLLPSCERRTPAFDLLIGGGPIYTGNGAGTVEAVGVVGADIVYVGALDRAQGRVDDHTVRIDLAGAALYPGFVDAHAHFRGIGEREVTLNLDLVGSIKELVGYLAAYRAENPDEAVVYGRGWIETHWPEDRFPTRHDLDAAIEDVPVILERADGHAVVANSAALAAAGISADTPDPEGGRIRHFEDGTPSGMLIDAAMNPVMALREESDEALLRRIFRAANDVYVGRGWTGLHNMSVDPSSVPILEEMSDSGAIDLRLYNSIESETLDFFAGGARASQNGKVRTRAVKLYMDGALGSRGAALFDDYADDPGHRGLLFHEKEDLTPLLTGALRNGIQINTHAIGPRANRLVLDLYEEIFAAVPVDERAVTPPRWRIEHAQILHPDDIRRFAALGVIASMQPSHAIGDLHFAPRRLGDERLAGAYAWQSLIESGAIIAAGSDAPVEVGDPLIEFYAAVARKDLNGFSAPNWHAEEAVDRETALAMLTVWPARAAFAEDRRGTIALGKQADFTAFDRDIMTVPERDIPGARAVLTVINGHVIHADLPGDP